MRQSALLSKTVKEAPKGEISRNAQLLTRAGYVDKLMAGAYVYLPLGLRTLNKIKTIIREEMASVKGQEIEMPALAPIENYRVTGRDNLDILFHTELASGSQLVLNQSHEEVVVPLVKKLVRSYKDLPVKVYQVTDKFRNEPRAKSGLLRGRQFAMKDLYSFHESEEDFLSYYEEVRQAYVRIFARSGLDARYVEASGGSFSKYSHEFQVLTESGEDLIFFCDACDWCQNREIAEAKDGESCPRCQKGTVASAKPIEVGNIFPLKDRFTKAFDFTVTGKDGQERPVIMGCYGIGPSRLMGTIAEVHNDERGLRWPAAVAPFQAHLVLIAGKNGEGRPEADELYHRLTKEGGEVLYDDREDVSAGAKLAEADLLGMPVRIVVSPKTLKEKSAELKKRDEEASTLVALEAVEKELASKLT